MANAAFWNGLAKRYAAQPVADPAAFERKIAITKSLLTPSSVVVEFGCGTGSLALRLAPHLGHLHGFDASSEMVRFARDKAAAAGATNLTFHLGAFDASFAAVDDASVDVVLTYSLLHLLEDREAALGRIFRLLKPGGFFVSSTPCIAESRIPYGPILKLMRLLNKAPWVSLLKRQTLLAEIERAGFVDVAERDVGAKDKVAFIVARKPG